MRLYLLPFLLVFTVALLRSLLHAQVNDIRYETITVDQGLSQSSVWCSMQDREGFLWFGTADGLNRYDGYGFHVFRHNASDSTSLYNNTVWSLLEDRSGRIWVGTVAGVDVYDKKSGTFTHLAKQERYKSTFLAGYTRSILEDRSGRIWFGAIDGIAILDPVTGDLTQLPAESSPFIAATQPPTILHEDDQGNIWYSFRAGLFYHQSATGRTIRVPVTQKDQMANITDSFIDDAGVFWLVTNSAGALSFDPKTNKWRSYTSDPGNPSSISDNGLRAIREDNTGRIWFGGATKGACYFERATGKFHPFRPSDPKSKNARYEGVASILRDRSGLLWIGYDGAGLVKVNPYKHKFSHYLLPPSGLTSTGDNFFKSLTVDHLGEVWLGTYDQGISVLNRSTGSVKRFRHVDADPRSLVSNSVFALLEDRSNNMWVGTMKGLDVFDRKNAAFLHLALPTPTSGRDKIITALYEDPEGTIWCGTATQLLKIDPVRREAKKVLSMEELFGPSIPPGVNIIASAADGGLWVGTLGGGLIKLRTDGTVDRIYNRTGQTSNTISHNGVKTIAIDDAGILWIGTEGGLSRFDPVRNQWRMYSTNDGLANDFIYGLLLDNKQQLWISTNRGLSRMDAKDPDHPNFKNFTPDDGLQSYEFNTNAYSKTLQGELFFGGVNGFNAFFPDSIIDNPVIPPVVLTGFKKFDQPFDTGGDLSLLKEIRLDYSETVFSFEFAALEFTNPGRNQYAYHMEGFGEDWIYCGNRREARYTHLDPGTYAFKVKGSNSDGVWNEAGTSITVVIVPPFWKTWWFLGLVALLGVGSFGGIVRFISVQKLKKRIQELEREKAIQDERQRTREQIARDLHDDLASTVGSAGFYVESVKHQMTDAPSEAKEFLDKTSSLLTEAEQAMSDIVWSVSPRHDTLESLLVRIRITTADICKANGMKYEVEIDPGNNQLNLSQEVRRNIYLVFKEAIANAARHSRGTLVRVRAKLTDGTFDLTVSDNGTGLPPQPAGLTKRGHGLRNMRLRAEEIGAKFSIEHGEGKGTTVHLLKRITQSGH